MDVAVLRMILALVVVVVDQICPDKHAVAYYAAAAAAAAVGVDSYVDIDSEFVVVDDSD